MKIGIIGGGAGGIFAAINFSSEFDVTILERNDRIGKKLLATGNGRCNLTNLSLDNKNYKGAENFVDFAINNFSNRDLISFFENIGMKTLSLEKGRVYPITLSSASVLNIFLDELKRKNVRVINNFFVNKIEKIDNKFKVYSKESFFEFDKIIFACGGMSMPVSGSDGSAFSLLKNLGHKITKLSPGLTQLKLKSDFLKHLSGTKVIGECKLIRDGKVVDKKYGDLLFTDYGISGPPIFDLSSYVSMYNDKFFIDIPLVNEVDKNFSDFYFSAVYMNPDFSLERFLTGFVNKKFIHYLLKTLAMDKNIPLSNLNHRDYENLLNLILHSTFEVIGVNSFKNSQVTLGGVDTREVDKRTFESKIVKGLYIIGEALDVAGDCGGYNLQWAFSTGYISSKAIEKLYDLD